DGGSCSPLGISCEHTEMLSLMKMVKQGLESHGLKVTMTREQNYASGQLPLYGKNSRTDKVYNSGAKVSISSHYNSAGTSGRGAFAMHAMQDTNNLSNRIITNLSTIAKQPTDYNQGTQCDVTKKTGNGTSYGYDYATPTSDCYYMVREFGGNITDGFDKNKDANGVAYNKNYRTPEPVLVEYFNGANSADVSNYKNNKSKYADAVIKAIVEYLGIPYKKTLIVEPIEVYSMDIDYHENIDNLK
ncbi:MAG: N-acetylmuramoyl-L-alanine amidase, partial [Culicoidibacterales bacterium]